MIGGIGNGRRNLVRVRVGELPAARPTKALPAKHLGSAMRTDPGKSCTAIAAKLRARWALTVTVVASRHPHFFTNSRRSIRRLVGSSSWRAAATSAPITAAWRSINSAVSAERRSSHRMLSDGRLLRFCRHVNRPHSSPVGINHICKAIR